MELYISIFYLVDKMTYERLIRRIYVFEDYDASLIMLIYLIDQSLTTINPQIFA